MASSSNCFAALSSLKMPSGKFVLESVSLQDKTTATGSNAIPVAPGNNKYATALKSKVSAGSTLKRKPALILGSKKLPPNVQATSAYCPSPSTPRQASKFSPQRQNLMFHPPRGLLPSKGLRRCCSLKQLKLVLPTGGTNFLN